MPNNIEHELRSVARKTCEICGRTELVSQPGPDAFVKWKVVEGTLCPRCARGPAIVAPSPEGEAA